VGVGAVTGVFIGLPQLFDSVHHSSVIRRTWVPFAIVAGVLLVAVAGYRWGRRNRAKKAPERFAGFTRITPPGAAILGFVLPVAGPKVLAMCATAGVTIGRTSVGGAGATLALVCYAALAGSPVIVSVVGYLLAAETVNRWLAALRLRLQDHQDTVTNVVIALIGLVLVGTGLRAM